MTDLALPSEDKFAATRVGSLGPVNHPGGSIIFNAAKGMEVPGKVRFDGSIIFKDADGNEIIKLSSDGFYVDGKFVEDRAKVYEGFCKFLANCHLLPADPETLDECLPTKDGVPLPREGVKYPFRASCNDRSTLVKGAE